MQFCEDLEKYIKGYTRPYRDPRSHKNHKRVMAQLKRISKAWRRLLRYKRQTSRIAVFAASLHKTSTHRLPPPFVKKVQRCFLPSF